MISEANTGALRPDRRTYIGGSDARIVLGEDEKALMRLWREKRGEIEPEDLSDNLLVQFGCVTEDLNRRWFEKQTGQAIGQVQQFVRHPRKKWMGATLDGMVGEQAVFEAKFAMPWNFAEDSVADRHMAQLQNNMLVTGAQRAFLSVLTGGAKWVSIEVDADPFFQAALMQGESIFWRAVRTGEEPRPFGVEPPRIKQPIVRIVDMSASNAWAEHAAAYIRTRVAHAEHERAKSELKAVMPDDAREAFGAGVRARRSKAGAVSFDLMVNGYADALGQ